MRPNYIILGCFFLIQFAASFLLPSHFVQKQKTSRFLWMSTEAIRGLLSGVANIKSAQYYSDNIEIDKATSLVLDKMRLFNICLENANGDQEKMQKTLDNLVQTADNFIDSRIVWDRQEFINSLENIIKRKGNFACVLAGKTTGKTLVLKDLQNRFPEKVFCVDLRRSSSDILTGLLAVLKQKINVHDGLFSLSETSRRFLEQVVVDCVEIVAPKENIDFDLQKYIDIIKKSNYNTVLETLIEKLVAKLGSITLIIDEANLALTIDDDTSEEDIKATRKALALFTSLTKVDNQVYI